MSNTVTMTEQTLRQAMRDRRYRDSGHPEREDYARWITEGFEALVASEQSGASGTIEVQVRPYTRVRDGQTENVDGYTQARRAAQADSSLGRKISSETVAQSVAIEPSPRAVTVFVGGLADQVFPIVRSEVDVLVPRTIGAANQYFAHDQLREILTYIDALPEATGINVVGFSWGADTAAQVAARLGAQRRRVDTLVTIDPVGRGTSASFFARVKNGADRWVNVQAAGGGASLPNAIAMLGSAYGEGPRPYADVFIAAPVGHNEFLRMMRTPDAAGLTAEQRVRDAVASRTVNTQR